MKRIVVLGSTGSIGTQTLDVVRRHPDKLSVVALAAGSRFEQVLEQAREFNVDKIVIGNVSLRDEVLAHPLSEGKEISFGAEELISLCLLDEADMIVNSLVGAAGLKASYTTLKAGKKLALANKESLVVGGDLLMPMSTPDTLLPIDSEHGAIYQCLLGEQPQEVSKLWITASGGPFR
ncbi:MAG: 1-deoxy-D-xylulose-5-phosphate reductoisomerase, partial [Anaerotardibacter sp.]